MKKNWAIINIHFSFWTIYFFFEPLTQCFILLEFLKMVLFKIAGFIYLVAYIIFQAVDNFAYTIGVNAVVGKKFERFESIWIPTKSEHQQQNWRSKVMIFVCLTKFLSLDSKLTNVNLAEDAPSFLRNLYCCVHMEMSDVVGNEAFMSNFEFIRWFHEFFEQRFYELFINLFVTSKNETMISPIHEFKVLQKGQWTF